MRYPPQNLPPCSHSQKPDAGTGGMGKKKEFKHLPPTPDIVYALESEGEG